MTLDLLELRPRTREAANTRVRGLRAEGDTAEAVPSSRAIVQRAVTKHRDESELAEMAQSPAMAAAWHSLGRPVETGRDEPCPCGSGRKYDRCCGA